MISFRFGIALETELLCMHINLLMHVNTCTYRIECWNADRRSGHKKCW